MKKAARIRSERPLSLPEATRPSAQRHLPKSEADSELKYSTMQTNCLLN